MLEIKGTREDIRFSIEQPKKSELKKKVKQATPHVLDVGLTPLVMALKTAICNNKAVLDWSPSECIFKLIFLLCLPELKKPLKAIRMIAFKTEELQMTSVSMARCGNLLELALLLMVAWEKLLDESTDLDECITKELQWTVIEEIKLFCHIGCEEVLKAHKRREKLLLSAGLMLHIFEQAGGVLDKFRLSKRTEPIDRHDLAIEFADCMRAAGFMLEIKGTREDIRFSIEQPKKSELKKKVKQATPYILEMPMRPPPLFTNAMMRIFHTCSFPRDSQFVPVAYCASRSLPPLGQ
ncbi:unnamed protein product [Cuscuta campestris]|uniref:Uncharacterized protein n=1 Tax=Cuscuta campestris TaxID=132261 RepID=A0A484N3E5_9ASTE|nr:unnamed protein product [Cuscuta campestris]